MYICREFVLIMFKSPQFLKQNKLHICTTQFAVMRQNQTSVLIQDLKKWWQTQNIIDCLYYIVVLNQSDMAH